ncbi:PREDICTED: butyrophilin subfamily 3 member A2-like [Calidris pugnax]|uniref:butyrophilin subfamily 3 member A2-like n=1 Tax=Calidris pugnax TaxID=198806 RepID=UPI00071C2A36|nr:PREDICTED: butyrophilin subfamily 3 member A2-like [Calidris pugnax]
MGFPTSPWGFLRHFLTLHLLQLGSAQFRVVGPGRPLLATVGQDVMLPCHLSPGMDARRLEIRWIRHLVSETVHLYRNGADQHLDQMKEYAGRTELSRDGLSRGSLDLRISGLRPSDDGQYVCTVQDAASYREALVELKVAAMGSVPLLSLEVYNDGGIQVVCRSAGWYPPPELLWKDGSGQHLPSVSQTSSPDARGLFEIQDVIVVSGKGDVNVSCVVRNSRLEQEQESSLHISAPFSHNGIPWMAAVGVLLVLVVVLFGVIAYLFRRKVVLSRALGESFWLLPPAKPPEKGVFGTWLWTGLDGSLVIDGNEMQNWRNEVKHWACDKKMFSLITHCFCFSFPEQQDAALGNREAELEQRDAALRIRESDLDRRDAALRNREAELEQQPVVPGNREAPLDQRPAAPKKRAAALEQRPAAPVLDEEPELTMREVEA